MKRLTKNLLNNSIEAFILSLETINRPSVKYRTEAFCFLFCNAWELLIKAKILNDGHKIFHKKKKKQPRRSLSLDECLNYAFVFEKDPIKLNILKIHELRNSAIHLVIDFVPPDIMGLFQAGVINYPKKLQEWFAINLSDRVPLGMMTIIYDFDPQKHSLENAKMSRKLPANTVKWLTDFQTTIREQAMTLGENALKYYVPISFKLAIVRNPDKADIVLSSGVVGTEALVVEVPKDPNKTHPYLRKDVVELLKAFGATQIISGYDVHCVKRVYKIESKAEFYYKPKYSAPTYSQKFVDWLVAQYKENPNFFAAAREKCLLRRVSSAPSQ